MIFPYTKRRAEIEARFRSLFSNISENTLDERQLINALVALEAERYVWLEQLRAFERMRVHEKTQGKRQPTDVEVETLHKNILQTVSR